MLALIAIAIAIAAWSVSAGALLRSVQLRRRAERHDAPSAPEIAAGESPAGASEESETGTGALALAEMTQTPPGSTSGAAITGLDVELIDSISRGLVVGLSDSHLVEATLMLEALSTYAHVAVGSGGAEQEQRARGMVSELAERADSLGVGPPIFGTAAPGGGVIFHAAEGASEPLLRAARWEASAREATRGAAARSASDLPTPPQGRLPVGGA